MRTINRNIASAIIISRDKKILMWKKKLDWWGVFSDCYHIPWWWVEEWETIEEAMIREVYEEVWLDVSKCRIKKLSELWEWTSEKIINNTWERVLCHMIFNRFEVFVDKNSEDIGLKLWDELVESKRFSNEELKNAKQIPWWKEFFIKMGYIV